MRLMARAWRAALAITASVPAILVSMPTPADADPLAPIWTGLYLGAQGGVNWSDVGTDFSSTLNATSFMGGGHIGYNANVGSAVIGIEADANYDSSDFAFTTAGGGTGSYDVDWNGTIRARAGMTFGPALIYATAGYAWTNASIAHTSATGASYSSSQHFDGVVYGAGVGILCAAQSVVAA